MVHTDAHMRVGKILASNSNPKAPILYLTMIASRRRGTQHTTQDRRQINWAPVGRAQVLRPPLKPDLVAAILR
jgi:hypothetical protein